MSPKPYPDSVVVDSEGNTLNLNDRVAFYRGKVYKGVVSHYTPRGISCKPDNSDRIINVTFSRKIVKI